jgi:diguanylate cyclase (GGDEF)-like protein
MDTACRYGGEEFVVIMATATLDMAMGRADELRQAFADMRVTYDSHELQGTISAGVATFPKHGGESDTLLRAADQALYMAKATGRNRVCAADPALGAASKLLTTP